MTISFDAMNSTETDRGKRAAIKELARRSNVLAGAINDIESEPGGGTPDDNSVTTAKIVDDAVTYAKIQNVSATDRLLGRSTAGAGNVEEISCTAAGRALIDDADAAAQRTTLGLGTSATHDTGFFAAAAHTHAEADITGLTADLAGKASTVHTHAEADVTGLTADLAAKAPLASPSLTGTPLAPTAAAGTNTTQIATTAFVHGEVVAASGGIVSPASLTDVADLVAWYSADNPANTIPDPNDGLITIFADKSGGGRHFTPGSGSIIKQYSQLAGNPVASFVGAMTANSQKTLPLKGALTFFAVLKITSTAAYQNLFAPGTSPADPTDLHLYWDQPTNKWQIDGRVTPTANVSGRWMTLVVHYYNVSTTMNMKLRENGASVQTQIASTTAAHPIPGTSGVPVNYDIRMFYNGGFAYTSQIAEWGFYAATRDGSEATLEKYLRAKYSTW